MPYAIHDDDAIVVCSDYHVIKALARALVFVADHPVTIRCGAKVIRIMDDADAVVMVPLARLRNQPAAGGNGRVDP